jgi:TPR repeat protein
MPSLYKFLTITFCSFFCIASHASTENISENTGQVSLITSLSMDDFARLENESGHFLNEYANGKISGDEFYKSLTNMLPSGELSGSWQAHLELWLNKYPQSYVANYLLGVFYENKAWQLRGHKFRSETTKKQFADFEEFSTRAEDQFIKSTHYFSKPYPTYCRLILIANALGNGKEAEYFRLAEKNDPAGYLAHADFLKGLAPKWGGSIAQVQAFVDSSSKSAMNAEDKKRIEALGFEIKGDDAEIREDYKSAIEFLRKAYFTAPAPDRLPRLVRAAGIAKKMGNPDQAIELYSEVLSIDDSNTRARNMRGYLLETEKREVNKAVLDYLASSEAGDSWAQNRIGYWYMTGYGVPKNFELAETYLNKAAAQGNNSAKLSLKELEMLKKNSN